ncbi:MAG TPA: hypothetical protein VGM39_12470 [Kofleriaceae bacterium]|jgi:hypothetical protein
MRFWPVVVASLAFVVACKRADPAVDSYVNEKMPVAMARLEDGERILKATVGSIGTATAASAQLVHAAKTLHTASTLMANITPPPAFKTAHESYRDESELLAKGFDSMITAANEHNDSNYTNQYTSCLTTLQALMSTDTLWEQLVKEAHVTQKKLPAAPAD